jgi:5'-methylthioadenosine phosphorylase
MRPRFAIIGGSGVYDPAILQDITDVTVDTTYGQVALKVGLYSGQTVAFISRHGPGHATPPHKVNYRANIWALKELGVERVFATAAVGSLQPSMNPGDLVVLDQFIDFTKSRPTTFFEGGEAGVAHVDMTEPYCPQLRQVLVTAGRELGIPLHGQGTYVCTEGPRFETPAEIRFYGQIGGHLVGMTNVPEVVLAREAELCYAAVAMVTNYAAGISATPLTHREVVEVMAQNVSRIKDLLKLAIERTPEERSCGCKEALKGARP